MELAKMQLSKLEKQLLRATEILTRVEDSELYDMIQRFDNTPAPDLNLDVNDHIKIYNWLQELTLYRKVCGPLNNIKI